MGRSFVSAGVAVLALSPSLLPALGALTPPTFTVNSVADVPDAAPDGICETQSQPHNGVCTLRAAIAEANATTGATIVVPSLGAVYLLGSGELLISQSMTIAGAGAAVTIVDGNLNGRVFDIAGGHTVSISGLTLQHGDVFGDGGALFNSGSLTLTRCVVRNNVSTAGGHDGGGLMNSGSLALVQSSVGDKQAGAVGRGIPSIGTLVLNGSLVAANTALAGGGISSAGISPTVTITNSTISGNSVSSSGGGIYLSGGDLRVFSSTITDNRADASNQGAGAGGGVALGGSGTRSFTNTLLV